jgi:hypothetical protein
MSALGGLNKTPNGLVIGLAQLQLPGGVFGSVSNTIALLRILP